MSYMDKLKRMKKSYKVMFSVYIVFWLISLFLLMLKKDTISMTILILINIMLICFVIKSMIKKYLSLR
ncbi:hypothetical protein DRN58_09460 [Thermococci archaeon]|nr:MAG: hypothetical protein DRN58_09460 [Thermococci archaeon]